MRVDPELPFITHLDIDWWNRLDIWYQLMWTPLHVLSIWRGCFADRLVRWGWDGSGSCKLQRALYTKFLIEILSISQSFFKQSLDCWTEWLLNPSGLMENLLILWSSWASGKPCSLVLLGNILSIFLLSLPHILLGFSTF